MNTKNITTLKSAIAAAVAISCAIAQQASAAWITGDISFQGTATLDDVVATSTKVTSYTNPVVGASTQTGNFVGTDGNAVTFNPFTFVPANASTPFTLWTFTTNSITYSFIATAITGVNKVPGSIPFLNVSGIGTLKETGFSDTPAAFSFTFTGKSATSTFASFGTAVPEPTTYALVSGLALVGFGMWRRRS
jgi:PEP-CTERM motif